jgi:fluoroquinolone resistance protein
MSKEYIENQHLKSQDFTETGLKKGQYENCTFTDCIFNNANLTDIHFTECTFDTCDLSNANQTAFKDVNFKNCKMLGLRFDACNPFLISFKFDTCLLSFSSFFQLKLKNTLFKDCKLEEVEFAETDLTSAVFKNCDLYRAVFDRTKLDGADFRSSFNFIIDPEKSSIYKAKFSKQTLAGLLMKYKIVIE